MFDVALQLWDALRDVLGAVKGRTAGNAPSPDRVDGHFAGTKTYRGPHKF